MKAVLLRDVTPAKQVHLEEVEIPSVRNGWVLVKVKAFGMNHSEQILTYISKNSPSSKGFIGSL